MKEQIKKLVAFVTSALMALALVPGIALAAGTGTITITAPTGDNGTETYTVYKVFDGYGNGTNVSYKVMSSKVDKALPEGFVTDSAGNVIFGSKDANGVVTPSTATELTADQIKSVADYVKGDTAVGTANKQSDGTYKLSGLEDGYYYVTTTSGSLVVINTANHDASVTDKNTVPSVTKKITSASSISTDQESAIAQLGSDVTYTATVTFGKGSKNVKFHDAMDSQLQLVTSGDNAPKVTFSNGGSYTATVRAGTGASAPNTGDTFTIDFQDGIPDGTVATITYHATLVYDAPSTDPADNSAKVTYGDNNTQSNSVETHVYDARFTVTKHDGNGKALAGAGFVVKNYDGKYYQKTGNKVSWVDSIDQATEYKSGADGTVDAFTGLANGTYTLVEKTVPAGYNKAADKDFTVKAANEDQALTAGNLEQTATVVNNAGSALPTTGGMGTTLFTVVGAALVVAAGVLLVTRRRMQQ